MEATKDPVRYKRPGSSIDCFKAMEEAFGIDAVMTFCKLNAFKYIWREAFKGHELDLIKAKEYIDKYLELLKKREVESYAE